MKRIDPVRQQTTIARWYWPLLTLLALNGSSEVFGQQQTGANIDFKGRLLVAVSDADMVPSAYIDGKLGPVAGKDALSIIRLDKSVSDLKAIAIDASNSVVGPPSSVAVSPDGRYAIVIETRGPRPAGKPNPLFRDLPGGKGITVIDLSDPDRPKVGQQLDGPEGPESVAINADGSLVAIAYRPQNTAQSPLAIYRFAGGTLSSLALPAIPGWVAGDFLNGAVFHPKTNTLALLNATKATLSFVRVNSTGSQVGVSSWGKPVLVEPEPCKVFFTPDGRFAVVNALSSLRGSVFSVRVAADTAADGSPVHQVVSRALAGAYSEGLALSPDGQWIVTVNLEQSFYPLDSPKQGFFSSISLIHIDPKSGLLERVGEFAFDGMLPESAVFDNSSRFLAVTTFGHYDTRNQPGGSIDFWRLAGDFSDPKRTELVKTWYSVPVTRGVHSMVIVR